MLLVILAAVCAWILFGSYTAILALLALTILVNANDDFVSRHTLLDELLQVISNYLFHMFSVPFWPSLVSCLPVHVRFRQCMMCRTSRDVDTVPADGPAKSELLVLCYS